MTQEVYCELLYEDFLPISYAKYGNFFLIHQDNDPKHYSNYCRSFLRAHNVLWVCLDLLKNLLTTHILDLLNISD